MATGGKGLHKKKEILERLDGPVRILTYKIRKGERIQGRFACVYRARETERGFGIPEKLTLDEGKI